MCETKMSRNVMKMSRNVKNMLRFLYIIPAMHFSFFLDFQKIQKIQIFSKVSRFSDFLMLLNFHIFEQKKIYI